MQTAKFLYSKKEAAAALGVSPRTVDYLIARGELETRRIGKKVLIAHEVLRRFACADHPNALSGGTGTPGPDHASPEATPYPNCEEEKAAGTPGGESETPMPRTNLRGRGPADSTWLAGLVDDPEANL